MPKLKPCQGCTNLRADLNREAAKVVEAKGRIDDLGREKAEAEYEAQRQRVRVESLEYALNLAWLHAKAVQDELAGLRARREFDKGDSLALAG